MQAAQNTAQIFLGINLKCNSCHDSFVSRWKLKDAYSLASYFSAEEKLQLYRCDIAQQQFAAPRFLYPELDRTPASNTLADRRSTAAAIFTDPRNGRLPRTRCEPYLAEADGTRTGKRRRRDGRRAMEPRIVGLAFGRFRANTVTI